jgi:hypothetical protein
MRGQVHAFPPDDAAFRRDVLEGLKALPEMTIEHAAEALTKALRATYPDVLVTARQKLGGYGDEELCYAFRDGRVSSASGHRERLAAESGRAAPGESRIQRDRGAVSGATGEPEADR